MKIELDEQTLLATMALASAGYFLYENPQYQEPALWIGGAIVVGWAAVMLVVSLGMLTDMLWWDALWKYTRGESDD